MEDIGGGVLRPEAPLIRLYSQRLPISSKIESNDDVYNVDHQDLEWSDYIIMYDQVDSYDYDIT